jgi:hypothetical protein
MIPPGILFFQKDLFFQMPTSKTMVCQYYFGLQDDTKGRNVRSLPALHNSLLNSKQMGTSAEIHALQKRSGTPEEEKQDFIQRVRSVLERVPADRILNMDESVSRIANPGFVTFP